MTAPVADNRVGSRVGEYTIDALVGIGGMARVYAATACDGTTVALKLVKPDYARDETFRRRFHLEAEIARTVDNPHLVKVYATGEHEDMPYMAEQFIEGESLDEKLRAEGQLDLTKTLRLCTEVAEGLQALWEAGMVHRDVKPGNILLDRAGRAYVTDFGLAKNTQGSVMTLPGQTVGTLDYMAPEQIRGETVTGAADVYSLGCVMFACLQGKPPFADRQGMRVLWAHLQDEPPDPCRTRTPLSPEFVQTLKTALRKQPSERPPSVVDYAAALSRAARAPALERSS